MKITNSQLKQIVKEEFNAVSEQETPVDPAETPGPATGVEDIGWYEACSRAGWPDKCQWVKEKLSMRQVYTRVRAEGYEPPGKQFKYSKTIIGALEPSHPLRRKYNRWYRWWRQQVKLGKTSGKDFGPEGPGDVVAAPGSGPPPVAHPGETSVSTLGRGTKDLIPRGLVKGLFFRVKSAIGQIRGGEEWSASGFHSSMAPATPALKKVIRQASRVPHAGKTYDLLRGNGDKLITMATKDSNLDGAVRLAHQLIMVQTKGKRFPDFPAGGPGGSAGAVGREILPRDLKENKKITKSRLKQIIKEELGVVDRLPEVD